ncbi:hemagglutinin repeat-containing protein [Algihabitans albus]|uniref:hemagglutinin repeat-containing protein n=1 Tax=Algihabitans albus TaxID=2164067 RepID=UPI000E5D0071|nr:hemagglutinin repeat-containing protein [Algihabitans albus]
MLARGAQVSAGDRVLLSAETLRLEAQAARSTSSHDSSHFGASVGVSYGFSTGLNGNNLPRLNMKYRAEIFLTVNYGFGRINKFRKILHRPNFFIKLLCVSSSQSADLFCSSDLLVT